MREARREEGARREGWCEREKRMRAEASVYMCTVLQYITNKVGEGRI
jgi:hypothetical protein